LDASSRKPGNSTSAIARCPKSSHETRGGRRRKGIVRVDKRPHATAARRVAAAALLGHRLEQSRREHCRIARTGAVPSIPLHGRQHKCTDRYQHQWRELLIETARDAHAAADLLPGTDPDQLAFELGAILAGTNIAAVLHDDNTIIDRARGAMRQRIRAD
jgi:hypothetical protein